MCSSTFVPLDKQFKCSITLKILATPVPALFKINKQKLQYLEVKKEFSVLLVPFKFFIIDLLNIHINCEFLYNPQFLYLYIEK